MFNHKENAGVLRREPNARNVSDPRETGEELGVRPIGFVWRLLHSLDIVGMSEFDVPLVPGDKGFSEIGDTGAGFDGNLDIVARAEKRDDAVDVIGACGCCTDTETLRKNCSTSTIAVFRLMRLLPAFTFGK